MLVTLAAQAIMLGRNLHAHIDADDYIHVLIACLAHDIGYVRGLFPEDDERRVHHRRGRDQGVAAARRVGCQPDDVSR